MKLCYYRKLIRISVTKLSQWTQEGVNITQTVNIFQCLHDFFLCQILLSHTIRNATLSVLVCPSKLFSSLHNEYTKNTRKYHHKLVCFRGIVQLNSWVCIANKIIFCNSFLPTTAFLSRNGGTTPKGNTDIEYFPMSKFKRLD